MTEHRQMRAPRPNRTNNRVVGRAIDSIGVWLLSAVLLVWTLLPIYNIIRVSMQEKEEVLSTSVYPIAPSPHAFSVVIHQAFWLLETFWNQMGNSFYIGIVVALLTLAIGSLTSFTISRMRIRSGWMLTNAALLTLRFRLAETLDLKTGDQVFAGGVHGVSPPLRLNEKNHAGAKPRSVRAR